MKETITESNVIDIDNFDKLNKKSVDKIIIEIETSKKFLEYGSTLQK